MLGGYSLGGIVAFEMARQLQAQSQKVALLALLDTYSPASLKLLPKTKFFRDKISNFGQRITFHWSNLSTLGPKERPIYIRQKVATFKRRIKSRIWQSTDKFCMAKGPPLPSILQIVKEANSQALGEYVPQPYQGRIALFRASEQSQGIYPDPHLGWGELVAGGIDVLDVPGGHGTMIEEPHVRVLAERLRACLNKAQPNGTGR